MARRIDKTERRKDRATKPPRQKRTSSLCAMEMQRRRNGSAGENPRRTASIQACSRPRDLENHTACELCDIQSNDDGRSRRVEKLIPERTEVAAFEDDGLDQSALVLERDPFQDNEASDPTRIFVLCKPHDDARQKKLEELFDSIHATEKPLRNARCANVLSSMCSTYAAMLAGLQPVP